VRTLLETFWEIVLSLLGTLALAGLLVLGGAILAVCALMGCGWAFWRRKGPFARRRQD
jgi:hypothetical protein